MRLVGVHVRPGMNVQTFGAAIDAALALHSPQVCLTCVAVLNSTTARTLAAEVAIFLAGHPSVTILDLMVRTQKRLLAILLSREASSTRLAPNGFA